MDGRLTQLTDFALNRTYQYDVGNRITSLTDTNANFSAQYASDKLNRITNQVLNQEQVKLSYTYDSNSNRTQKYTQGNFPTQYEGTFAKPYTNQVQDYTYDGSGKVTSDGQRSYSYNSEGRIERIQNGNVGIYNAYNALGQRVQKNSGDSKTYFLYDESGALMGEYDGLGTVLREYVYLAGRPIAMLSSEKPNQVLQVHTDHLGTPRAVSDATNQVLWRWEGDAFGDVQPQLATVKMPLRMAGQYADDETGLFYNYFRFYDPKTGRYVENDPIDLAGGLNRYAYVGGNALGATDPRGENAIAVGAGIAIVTAAIAVEFECNIAHHCGGLQDGLSHALSGIATWMEANESANESTETATKGETCPAEDSDHQIIQSDKNPQTLRGPKNTTIVGPDKSTRFGPDGHPEVDRENGHPNEAGIGNGDHAHDWGRPADGSPPTYKDRSYSRPVGAGDPPKPWR